VKSIAFETNLALSEFQKKYRMPLKDLPRLHNNAVAVISLVGDRITSTPELMERALGVLKGICVVALPARSFQSALSFLVGPNDLVRSLTLLHQEYFEHIDSDMFVVPSSMSVPAGELSRQVGSR
jgi:hypothetical protein